MISIKKCICSFRYAFQGVKFVLMHENNFRFHLFIGLGIVIVGLWIGFNFVEWCIIILLIGAVLVAEVFNTAIEKVMNKISPTYDMETGLIKDIAAGAVLIMGLTAAFVGIIIIIGKL